MVVFVAQPIVIISVSVPVIDVIVASSGKTLLLVWIYWLTCNCPVTWLLAIVNVVLVPETTDANVPVYVL